MAAPKAKGQNGYTLVVPLDASGIEGFEPDQAVKVLVQDARGQVVTRAVQLDEQGRGEAQFRFDEQPSGFHVVLGPEDADDETLLGMETITADVSRRRWVEATDVRLDPLIISPFYWWWWRFWCRQFTIRGRLVCPDGSPVPGAKVCAYDLDRFWWWVSLDQVGCDTTDVNGAFEITFTWCCGFWPWWWWARRLWQVEPYLAERIQAVLEADPLVARVPVPSPRPDTGPLEELLGPEGLATAPPEPIADPSVLESLQQRLVERFPIRPELEALRVWPWVPWRPWWDCTPDIVFKATQDCGQGQMVILDEGYAQTRWNIPTSLTVTLVAEDACCVRRPPPPCGDIECITFSKACQNVISSIGGNVGAPATPRGYLNPGAAAVWGDRPYAGTISVRGVCDDWIDYYGVEISSDGGATWSDLPPAAAGGYSLRYFDLGTLSFPSVSFPFQMISGMNVIESVAHWESVNGPKAWIDDTTMLFNWITAVASSPTGPTALFPDGTYELRLRAWELVAPNTLGNSKVPPLCGAEEEARIVLTIDNRMVGPGAGHPNAPGHQCGGVHACTTEPDTDFIAVRVDGAELGACAIVDTSGDATLEIDFLAHDPDGHLAYYTLSALWGENQSKNLLTVPGASLTRIAADQVGWHYGLARTGAGPENLPAAVEPVWEGGTMRLTVPLAQAFEEPCCYLLDLWAYKRTVDSCDHNYTHRNRSTFTFTIS